MNILATIVISAIATIGSFFGVYNYLPLKYIQPDKDKKLGSTITTIQGTDTLSSSRAVINTNFANLNADKLENTATSFNSLVTASSLTTAPSLSSIGTITSGTWNGTTIDVSHGGTASTTLSLNQILLGNGTNGLKVVSGYGTSGQSLVSNGTGSAPTWQSVGVDQTADFNFTGTNFLVKNLSASSTVSNPIKLNGVLYSTPSTQGTASSTLVNNGSGALTWNRPDLMLIASTTLTSTVSTTTLSIPAATDLRIVINPKAVTSSSGGTILYMQLNTDTGNNYAFANQITTTATTYGNGNSVNVIRLNATPSAFGGIGNGMGGIFDVRISNTASAPKYITWNGASHNSGGTNYPDFVTGSAIWNNTTSQITSISIGVGDSTNPQTLGVGTRISVYGSNQ